MLYEFMLMDQHMGQPVGKHTCIVGYEKDKQGNYVRDDKGKRLPVTQTLMPGDTIKCEENLAEKFPNKFQQISGPASTAGKPKRVPQSVTAVTSEEAADPGDQKEEPKKEESKKKEPEVETKTKGKEEEQKKEESDKEEEQTQAETKTTEKQEQSKSQGKGSSAPKTQAKK